MDRQSILKLISEIAPRSSISDQGGWVMLSCPLARWTHARGKDENPSFGIEINDDGPSRFNCFSCHNHGDVEKLVGLLSEYSGEDYGYLLDDVVGVELFGLSLPSTLDDAKAIRRGHSNYRTDYEDDEFKYSEWYYKLFPLATGHEYLKSRNVPDWVVEELDIRVDPCEGKSFERILLPLIDTRGKYVGMMGRATTADTKIKVKYYEGSDIKNHLLGGHIALLSESETVLIVEGPFDYIRAYMYGYNAVACMTSMVSKGQAREIAGSGKKPILMLDNDKAGKAGTKISFKNLKHHSWPIFRVNYTSRYDDVKDPDMMTEAQMYCLVKNKLLC